MVSTYFPESKTRNQNAQRAQVGLKSKKSTTLKTFCLFIPTRSQKRKF